MKYFWMYESVILIISGYMTSQMEELNTDMQAEPWCVSVCRWIWSVTRPSNGDVLLCSLTYTGTTWKSVQNCLKRSRDFLPPTVLVALWFGLHISLLTDNSEPSASDHASVFFFCFALFFSLYLTSLCRSIWGSGVRWRAEAFPFRT